MKLLDESFEKKTFYKYAKFEDLKHYLSTDSEKSGTLGFRSIREYNDPFEGHFRISCPSQEEKFAKKRAFAWKKTQRQRFLATCFSEDNNNTLMWAHYANNHTGICLEFSIEHLFLKQDLGKVFFGEVEYSSKYPTYLLTSNTQNDHRDRMLLDSMTRKSLHWAYEKEYRLIINTRRPSSDAEKIPFEVKCLKSVSVGAKMADCDVLSVKENIEEHNYFNGTNVAFYDSQISHCRYEMVRKEFGITSDPEVEIVFVNDQMFSNKSDVKR